MSAAPAVGPRLLLVLRSGVDSAAARLRAAEVKRASLVAQIERLAAEVAQTDQDIWRLRVELARSKLNLNSLGGGEPAGVKGAGGRSA